MKIKKLDCLKIITTSGWQRRSPPHLAAILQCERPFLLTLREVVEKQQRPLGDVVVSQFIPLAVTLAERTPFRAVPPGQFVVVARFHEIAVAPGIIVYPRYLHPPAEVKASFTFRLYHLTVRTVCHQLVDIVAHGRIGLDPQATVPPLRCHVGSVVEDRHVRERVKRHWITESRIPARHYPRARHPGVPVEFARFKWIFSGESRGNPVRCIGYGLHLPSAADVEGMSDGLRLAVPQRHRQEHHGVAYVGEYTFPFPGFGMRLRHPSRRQGMGTQPHVLHTLPGTDRHRFLQAVFLRNIHTPRMAQPCRRPELRRAVRRVDVERGTPHLHHPLAEISVVGVAFWHRLREHIPAGVYLIELPRHRIVIDHGVGASRKHERHPRMYVVAVVRPTPAVVVGDGQTHSSARARKVDAPFLAHRGEIVAVCRRVHQVRVCQRLCLSLREYFPADYLERPARVGHPLEQRRELRRQRIAPPRAQGFVGDSVREHMAEETLEADAVAPGTPLSCFEGRLDIVDEESGRHGP